MLNKMLQQMPSGLPCLTSIETASVSLISLLFTHSLSFPCLYSLALPRSLPFSLYSSACQFWAICRGFSIDTLVWRSMFIAYQLDKRSLGLVAAATPVAAAAAAARHCLPTVVAPICGTLLVGRPDKASTQLCKKDSTAKRVHKTFKACEVGKYERGKGERYI